MADKKSDKKDDETQTAFVVTNVKPRLITIAGISIPPGGTTGERGIPHIPKKHVEGVKKSPVFRAGELVEGKKEISVGAPIAIETLDIDQACKIVSAESEISILSGWADKEDRKEVLAAIKARLFLLK